VTTDGGHPVIVLSDYPPLSADLVIFANLTHVNNVKGATLLFKAGYKLSSVFTTTEDSTIFHGIAKCTRWQADSIVNKCQDRGFINASDLATMRAYVGKLLTQISDKSVRAEIIRLGW
jgi:hypothetical protein